MIGLQHHDRVRRHQVLLDRVASRRRATGRVASLWPSARLPDNPRVKRRQHRRRMRSPPAPHGRACPCHVPIALGLIISHGGIMPMTDGGRRPLTLCVRGSQSALCLAAVCPAGRPPGDGGDRRVGLVQRLRCPGRRITALGGQRQAMHERPGQRQGDGQQQPHPQAPGEKCPHAQGPFVVPARFPALPALPRAKHVPSRLLLHLHVVTRRMRTTPAATTACHPLNKRGPSVFKGYGG